VWYKIEWFKIYNFYLKLFLCGGWILNVQATRINNLSLVQCIFNAIRFAAVDLSPKYADGQSQWGVLKTCTFYKSMACCYSGHDKNLGQHIATRPSVPIRSSFFRNQGRPSRCLGPRWSVWQQRLWRTDIMKLVNKHVDLWLGGEAIMRYLNSK
jgi:hypothetical protein